MNNFMDSFTVEAVKGARQKWIGIAIKNKTDLGSKNCPLCKEFLYDNPKCRFCPIKKETQLSGCSGTIYGEWLGQASPTLFRRIFGWGGHKAKSDYAKLLAWKFAVLIDGLLPKEHQQLQTISGISQYLKNLDGC